MQPVWSSSKSHQYPMNSKVFCMPYFFLKHLSLSNKILIFLYSIFCCTHRLHPLFRENFLWLRKRERINILLLKKYVDNNNNNDLPQGYYKTFFWKNLLLMKVTPILNQAVFSLPQNVGERFNIHSKILKKPFLICFQLREKVVIFKSSWLINFMNPASLSFQFQVNIFWSNNKKSSVFTCQFH